MHGHVFRARIPAAEPQYTGTRESPSAGDFVFEGAVCDAVGDLFDRAGDAAAGARGG